MVNRFLFLLLLGLPCVLRNANGLKVRRTDVSKPHTAKIKGDAGEVERKRHNEQKVDTEGGTEAEVVPPPSGKGAKEQKDKTLATEQELALEDVRVVLQQRSILRKTVEGWKIKDATKGATKYRRDELMSKSVAELTVYRDRVKASVKVQGPRRAVNNLNKLNIDLSTIGAVFTKAPGRISGSWDIGMGVDPVSGDFKSPLIIMDSASAPIDHAGLPGTLEEAHLLLPPAAPACCARLLRPPAHMCHVYYALPQCRRAVTAVVKTTAILI